MQTQIVDVEFTHFHLCGGLGGGALGFNRGRAEVANLRARFRCIGAVDVDAAACRDFTARVGAPATCLDLFDRAQYVAFHGHEPPEGWGEATPEDIRRAAHGELPDIVFASMPCKGFSGLLSESKSRGEKYQALNRLTLRGIWLMLEAFKDRPPKLIIFENVPRIATRGRWLLDQIQALYRAYGYAYAETVHDCGEVGGLAQSRKRFLMVARHVEQVPPFLYEPPRRPLRAVGDILGKMPLPGDLRGGPMHAIPNLQWKTWVRLAFVEAGSDWRSLKNLRVEDGKLADYLIIPQTVWEGAGRLVVTRWNDPSGTIAGASRSENGAYNVADPRINGHPQSVQLGVRPWTEPAPTVTGQMYPGQGPFSVADPRWTEGPNGPHYKNTFRIIDWDQPSFTVSSGHGPSSGGLCVSDPRMPDTNPNRQNGIYRVVKWEGPSHTVTGADHITGGALSVADPRYTDGSMGQHANKMRVVGWESQTPTITGSDRVGSGALSVADPRPPAGGHHGSGKYRVTEYTEPAGTVIAESGTGNGAYAVADPRILDRQKGDNYLTGGHYGVIPWDGHSYTVSGSACHDNGPWSVADPRMPAETEKLVAVIRSLDGTWHRPFTTLELAALQSLVDPEELFFDLDGTSDSAKRERIGNAVPPYAAQQIANMMGETLLLAMTGETFQLSALPVWVRPVAVALSVRIPK